MTDQNHPAAPNRPNRRSNGTPAWKSALLASALGTVILGWGIIGCSEIESAVGQSVPASNTLDNQVFEDDSIDDEDVFELQSNTLQSMPQAPTFRQPPARTRGS